MTDLETAKERLRTAEAEESAAWWAWHVARSEHQNAVSALDVATGMLLESRERMRDARDAVVKLERQ